MVSTTHLTDEAAAVLTYLHDLDTRAGGYTRRGVRGWARREEIEASTGLSLPELLPRLRNRGLVEEDHVHVTGTRPIAVYRITGSGDLLLARRERRQARPPWPAGERTTEDAAVFIPPAPAVALRLLKAALVDPAPGRFPGVGPGWRSESDLWEQLAPELDRWETGEGPWLPGDPPWKAYGTGLERRDARDLPPGRLDLEWLERAGLVERSSITPLGRTRPVSLWRASSAGAAATELAWYDPREPNAGST